MRRVLLLVIFFLVLLAFEYDAEHEWLQNIFFFNLRNLLIVFYLNGAVACQAFFGV